MTFLTSPLHTMDPEDPADAGVENRDNQAYPTTKLALSATSILNKRLQPDRVKRSPSPLLDHAPEAESRSIGITELNYLDEEVEIYEGERSWDSDTHEGVPQMAASRAEYKAGLQAARDGVDVMNKGLANLETLGKEITTILDGMVQAKDADYGKQVQGGVVGETGCGKSRLENAVLGYDELAKQGDSGNSVTQVVSKFLFNPNSTEDINATVFFRSENQIDKLVNSFFRAYADFRKSGATDESVESDDNGDYNDYHTAQNFLLEVFVEGIFPDNTALDAAVDELNHPGNERAIESYIVKLQTHLHHLIRSHLDDHSGGYTEERCIRIRDPDPDFIREECRPYSERPSTGSTGFWQLVERVEICLPSKLLGRGLSIVDCPGLTDYHALRRQAAEDYLKKCDIIFILAPIRRIIDDPDVRKYVRTYAALKGLANVVVIPTMIDDINEPPRSDGSGREELELKKWQDEITAIKKGTHISEETKRGLNKRDLANMKKELAKNVQDRLVKPEAEFKRAKIMLRNKIVKRELQSILPEVLQGQELTVIPTSSRAYQYHSGFGSEPTCLHPGEDGVAELRRPLFTRGQRGRLRQLQRHIDTRMRIPLICLRMVLEKDVSERQECVFVAVEEATKASAQHILRFEDSIIDASRLTWLRVRREMSSLMEHGTGT
ncbi:hypothetical protein BDZ85DRAFT_124153 [Elsinoe ampelina]|uniref:Dynamin N-terminal domain-containing protein n=1 Tax=Elsinoe ampelina TaxID=302913 RepID=A0A6A6GBY2_9PEZI|nr:hypothetical protein BDZ85DRAFT_124153 [Elsinoe ampelina]